MNIHHICAFTPISVLCHPGMYSVISSFAEPGESIQEAVAREVKEEAGTAVQVIRYFGSQPWPFPHSPMIAYTATYTAGEISIDDTEIEEAGWFTVDNLPPIPEGSASLAN